jgi:hypothetical protein
MSESTAVGQSMLLVQYTIPRIKSNALLRAIGVPARCLCWCVKVICRYSNLCTFATMYQEHYWDPLGDCGYEETDSAQLPPLAT